MGKKYNGKDFRGKIVFKLVGLKEKLGIINPTEMSGEFYRLRDGIPKEKKSKFNYPIDRNIQKLIQNNRNINVKNFTLKNKKYYFEKTILDNIRDWRSTAIVSDVSNSLATFITKISRTNTMTNHDMNVLRGITALVISETINKVFSKPLNFIENIKVFIKVSKVIYKVVLYVSDNVVEFSESKVGIIKDIEYPEYSKFLLEHKKVASLYDYMDDRKKIIGKEVNVIIDRALGEQHPKYKDMIYLLNYGYIKDYIALDLEYQDAYIIDENKPMKEYKGKVVAIIHRKNDIEDKWVVSNKDKVYSKDEIYDAVKFQEKYFDVEIII